MPDRTLNWGASSTDAVYRSQDTDEVNGGGNFVVVEDTDAGTVLLEWDATAGEWVSRGPVNMSGNDVTGVGALDATSVSADILNNTAYASNYSGADLGTRISNALNDVDIVKVATNPSGYDWFTHVSMGSKQAVVFDDFNQSVTFSGSSGSGDSDIMITGGNQSFVWGGEFGTTRDSWSTGDPWEAFRLASGLNDFHTRIRSTYGFEYGYRAVEDGGATIGYNDIRARRAANHWRAFHTETGGTGTPTVSQNWINLGRLFVGGTWSDGTERAFSFAGGGLDNVIWNTSIENGGDAGAAIYADAGESQRFNEIRTEGWATEVDTSNHPGTDVPIITIDGVNYDVRNASQANPSLNSPNDLRVWTANEKAVSTYSDGLLGGTTMITVEKAAATVSSSFNAIHVKSGTESGFGFAGWITVVGDETGAAERTLETYRVAGSLNDTSATPLDSLQGQGDGTFTVAIDYSNVHGGEHTIQVTPDATWGDAPDVTVAGIFNGAVVDAADDT